MADLIFHESAPFNLFCDDGVVARPCWRLEDAYALIGNMPEHSWRLVERNPDGSMCLIDLSHSPAVHARFASTPAQIAEAELIEQMHRY